MYIFSCSWTEIRLKRVKIVLHTFEGGGMAWGVPLCRRNIAIDKNFILTFFGATRC